MNISRLVEFVRYKKEIDEDRKNELREIMKTSTVELLLKMHAILQKNGGEFIVGNRVSKLLIIIITVKIRIVLIKLYMFIMI